MKACSEKDKPSYFIFTTYCDMASDWHLGINIIANVHICSAAHHEIINHALSIHAGAYHSLILTMYYAEDLVDNLEFINYLISLFSPRFV